VTAPPPPPEGRFAHAAHAIRSLTLTNVLVIFLLLGMILPAYVVYRALSDEALLDRFLSSYRVIGVESGCTIRMVAERGGPEQWSIATGFAAAGSERWNVSVVLEQEPSREQIASHCATLMLIVERLPHSVP
jgi:hypothetical protein